MKELSIEQKAQAYDEAFNVALETYQTQPMYRAWLKKMFPELSESEDEKVRKGLLVFCRTLATGRTNVLTNNIDFNKWIAWLEKQGQQKPTDKIKPKFHEGEWITNGDYTWKIVEVKPLDYILQSQDGNIVDDTISHVDEQFHSFTIADARDGDVLWHSDTASHGTFIFKQIRYDGKVLCYCDYDSEDHFCTGEHHTCCWSSDKCIKPATKEQRDTLMKAMADAGCAFDFEKKELKKIENEIDIPFGAKDSELQEATYYIPKGFHAEINDDKVVIKKGEITTAWSEEDEDYINDLIKYFSQSERPKNTKEDIVIWLKSLKNRVQPKQGWSEEDEDMIQALDACIDAAIKSGMNYISFDSKSILIGKVKNWLKSLRPQNRWISIDKEVYVKEPVLAQKKDKSDTFKGYVVCCDHTLVPNVYERYMILGDIVSQNRWKPSDEQIRVLDLAIRCGINRGTTEETTLVSLFHDLKKLREE